MIYAFPRATWERVRIIKPRHTRYLDSYRGAFPEWFNHYVIVKNNKVYDAFTDKKGLHIRKYKKLWGDPKFDDIDDVIDFGF